MRRVSVRGEENRGISNWHTETSINAGPTHLGKVLAEGIGLLAVGRGADQTTQREPAVARDGKHRRGERVKRLGARGRVGTLPETEGDGQAETYETLVKNRGREETLLPTTSKRYKRNRRTVAQTPRAYVLGEMAEALRDIHGQVNQRPVCRSENLVVAEEDVGLKVTQGLHLIDCLVEGKETNERGHL